MANRIKGITVEIGGDTTKLSKALEGVNKDIKGTQTQLKDVQKLLKLDPTNTELLSQKHKLLADPVSATKEKLEVLKTAAEQANTALANGEISQQQYDALQREIIETENRSLPRWPEWPTPETIPRWRIFLIKSSPASTRATASPFFSSGPSRASGCGWQWDCRSSPCKIGRAHV